MSELTVEYVQIFGMKVGWEQVIKDVFTALRGHYPCEVWQENREE